MSPSLYIHVPFCLSKCRYCDFHSAPLKGQAQVDIYAKALVLEARLRSVDDEISTLYIGGGTPTVLPPQALETLFRAIAENFRLANGAEVTVEANPGAADAQKLSLLKSLGVNRISLGVQSFDDQELRVLGRMHSAKDALTALDEMPFDNRSIDLIYGIPGQGEASWARTLARATALGVPHVSAYELTPEPGTPLYADLEAGVLTLPDEDSVLALASQCHSTLAGAGLERYEVSNYAKPGCQSRHNINYWQRGRYIALGPGAHGFMDGQRYENVSDLTRYAQMVEQGQLPEVSRYEVSADEALREALMLGLRMVQGVEVAAFGVHWPRASAASQWAISQGLLEVRAGRLRASAEGMCVLNAVLVEIFDALDKA